MRLHPTSGTEALPLPSGKAPHPLPQRIENRREGTPFAPLPPLVPACLQPVLLTGCFFICLVFLCSWARRALGCRLRPLTAAPMHRIKRREGAPFAPLPPLVPACLQPVLLTGCFFICLVFLCSWARRALGCRLRPLTAAPMHRIKRREGAPFAPLPPLVPACLQPVLLTGCFFVCLVLPYSWARCALGCRLRPLTAAPMHRIKRREGMPFAPLPPLVPACLQPVLSIGCFFRLLGFPLFMGTPRPGLHAPLANRAKALLYLCLCA